MDKQTVAAAVARQGRRAKRSLLSFVKWGFYGLLCGTLAGVAGTALYWVIATAQGFREQHGWLLYLLPVAGLLITLIYRALGMTKDRGTNLIICATRGEEEVPLRMSGLIFIGTVLTHLCGGSTGREGAALQLGGGIGSWLSRVFKLDRQGAQVLVMCGMSAAFAAIFGTPITAAVFSLEIATVGVMPFVAFWPCALSSLLGFGIRVFTGAGAETFHVAGVPEFHWLPVVQIAVLAAACSLVSQLFCHAMSGSGKLMDKVPFLKNPYARIVCGAVAVIALSLLLGTTDYNGAGMHVIEKAVHEGQADWYAFLLKIVFTVITLKCGFKGGEIVPALFIGATFGCTFAGLIGLSPMVGAAIGMAALFAGVTNCPIASILLSFELFGSGIGLYALLAVPVCWSLSGYSSLYSKQHFLYSKYQIVEWKH